LWDSLAQLEVLEPLALLGRPEIEASWGSREVKEPLDLPVLRAILELRDQRVCKETLDLVDSKELLG